MTAAPKSETAVWALAALAAPLRSLLDADARRRWDVHAAAGTVTDLGCGGPTRCGPCALQHEADRRERHEAELAEIARQHRISAARIAARAEAGATRRARRRVADVRRMKATAAIAPGAACRVCRSTPNGRECRSCGSTTVTAEVAPTTLMAAASAVPSPGRDPLGFSRALHQLARDREADEIAACLGVDR